MYKVKPKKVQPTPVLLKPETNILLSQVLINPTGKLVSKFSLHSVQKKQQVCLEGDFPSLDRCLFCLEYFSISLHLDIPTAHNHDLHGNVGRHCLNSKRDLIKN